jgi:hypothetical protein
MRDFLMIKVLDEHRQDIFYNFAIDGIQFHEGNDHLRQFHNSLFLPSDLKHKMNDRLQDGMIELHDFDISLGEDQRVEGIFLEDLTQSAV